MCAAVSAKMDRWRSVRSCGHWVWAMPSSCIRATVHRSAVVRLRCCFARRTDTRVARGIYGSTPVHATSRTTWHCTYRGIITDTSRTLSYLGSTMHHRQLTGSVEEYEILQLCTILNSASLLACISRPSRGPLSLRLTPESHHAVMQCIAK